MPTITAVIPAFNASEWIDETLESVVGQSDPPDEILVVDDGSTDDTPERARRHGDRVRVIGQSNAGCGMAFNRGIAEARCDFIALCPADDIWEPRKIEFQRATLLSHPDVDVSFGAAEDFGLREGPTPRPTTVGLQDRDRFLRDMLERNVVPDPSVVVRRSLWERLGGFIPDIGEDYEFWARAIADGAVFHYDDRLLVRLRQHGGNLSAQASAIWRMNVQVHRQLARLLGEDAVAQRVLARDLARLGRCEAGAGKADEARAAFRESLRHRPSGFAAAGATALALPGSGRAVAAIHRWRVSRGA